MPERRLEFHYSPVLVEAGIADGHLSLAERVVQDIVYHFRGNAQSRRALPVYREPRLEAPVLLIAVIIPIVSLITLFLFRNRKLQMKAILILIILVILLIGTSAYYILPFIRPGNGNLIPVFRMFIPVINLVLCIMAYFAVRKDENIVRSYDRLR